MGSSAAAAWIAQVAFWVLLARGWMAGDLGPRGALVALALWVAAYIGLTFVPYGPALFAPCVAIIDIGLVFVIFRGDVHIT